MSVYISYMHNSCEYLRRRRQSNLVVHKWTIAMMTISFLSSRHCSFSVIYQPVQAYQSALRRKRWSNIRTSMTNEASAVSTSSSLLSSSSSSSFTPSSSGIRTTSYSMIPIRISESVWRKAAQEHQAKIYEILKPGLTDLCTHPINTGHQRQQQQQQQRNAQRAPTTSNDDPCCSIVWTALDPRNPIYNFLIEYYGIKGTKGVKRLARWSPGLYCQYNNNNNSNNNDDNDSPSTNRNAQIGGGVLLEGANENDLSSLLHLRGAIIEDDGIMYCPQTYYNEKQKTSRFDGTGSSSSSTGSCDDIDTPEAMTERRQKLIRLVAPFLWYRAVLEQTLSAEPVLYCYGLHEWAMQYQPQGAPIPPSAKYQSHVPLRVTQDILNHAVERVGTRCTHVDALRYFAPAAAPLNYHGEQLQRIDQIRLEQPGCVHAHMDLLKIILKLEPYVDATLLQQVLEVAILARKLDIGASPYDVTSTYQVEMIPIETEEGRVLYRQRQLELMKVVQPIRTKVLQAYNDFLSTTFTPDLIQDASISPDPNERYTQTTPGGLPWRKNTIHS